MKYSIVGIDLAGSEKRNTGVCYLENHILKTTILKKDQDILNLVVSLKPELLCVDAPLSIPAGRKNLEDRSGEHLRECDKLLLKMGIKFFPVTLGPMRMLTKRGIKLKNKLEKMIKDIEIIEVFPGGFYDILNLQRKNKKQIVDYYNVLFQEFGWKIEKIDLSQDELDSIACFLTGIFYLSGEAFVLEGKDGKIVLPKK